MEQGKFIAALEDKFQAELQKGSTLVCTFGLQDTKRQNVDQVIEDIVETGTFPRIVSGDHHMAVKKCAMACHLLNDDGEGMYSGEWFQENVGNTMESVKEKDGRLSYKFVSRQARKKFSDELCRDIKVLYRADPAHKHMLVKAL